MINWSYIRCHLYDWHFQIQILYFVMILFFAQMRSNYSWRSQISSWSWLIWSMKLWKVRRRMPRCSSNSSQISLYFFSPEVRNFMMNNSHFSRKYWTKTLEHHGWNCRTCRANNLPWWISILHYTYSVICWCSMDNSWYSKYKHSKCVLVVFRDCFCFKIRHVIQWFLDSKIDYFCLAKLNWWDVSLLGWRLYLC